MISTVTALLDGKEGILACYQEAKQIWEKIWADPKSETVEGLSDLIFFHQSTFEHSCGGRYLGQEVMVLSSFMMFYDIGAGFEGNEEKVERLKEAFNKAHVSFEIESMAQKFAKYLYL
ncbi:hypothetical protein CON39_11960 [Bacillus thuringiensis]|uniref:hypothetical protein n=1 Tax=Bacillus thuringiensis TaxID=1428 RepID=UPI000BEB2CD8|nr:hypothetical protein [Bacillus thuringiensis]PEF30379.1 hypothetical protein CON39_11960 [Bacillus thuringiensis]